MLNSAEIGRTYEEIAQKHIKKQGYKIIETNFRLPVGEIDIIAKDKKTIVFVEVKYRHSNNYGEPGVFVDKRKQLKIIKTAIKYLKNNKINANIRFDVVSICDNDIELIKNAFTADNTGYIF